MTALPATFTAKQTFTEIMERYRLLFWTALLTCTGALLAFPTHLKLEDHPVQSVYVFDNLPLFGALFYLWMLLLLLVLFTIREGEKGTWEGVAISIIFPGVFLGFWTVAVHRGLYSEGISQAAHVKYLESTDRIPLGHQTLGYFGFPGLPVVGDLVSKITGLEGKDVATLLVLLFPVLLGSLLYVLYRRFFDGDFGAQLAPMAVLLAIQGNIALAKLNFFHARGWAILLLIMFLILLNRHRGQQPLAQERVMLMIILGATAITHFVTAALFSLITTSLFIIQKITQRSTIGFPMLALSFFIVAAWMAYWPPAPFASTIGYVQIAWQQLGGLSSLLSLFTSARHVNPSAELPLWASISRFSPLVLLYGFALVLLVRNLFRLAKLSLTQLTVTAALLGSIVLGTLSILSSLRAERAESFFLYAGFVVVPIVLWFLATLRNRPRRLAFSGLIAFLFALSLATFLSNNDTVLLGTWLPDDHAAARFATSPLPQPSELYVLEGESTFLLRFYSPDASVIQPPTIPFVENIESFWQTVRSHVARFVQGGGSTMFMISKRSQLYYQHFLGISPDDIKWHDLKRDIAVRNNIYDNGNIQLMLGNILTVATTAN